jgi:hypothetical protein
VTIDAITAHSPSSLPQKEKFPLNIFSLKSKTFAFFLGICYANKFYRKIFFLLLTFIFFYFTPIPFLQLVAFSFIAWPDLKNVDVENIKLQITSDDPRQITRQYVI